MNNDLDFLEAAIPEFEFIEGFESGRFIDDFDDGVHLFDAIPGLTSTSQHWSARLPEKPFARTPTNADDVARFAKHINRLHGEPWEFYNGTWPITGLVYQRPEGHGKSSLVRNLVDSRHRVVFCAKSNDQLEEQERGFKERWPELRIHRHISKGRHLQERLRELGIDFKLVYYEQTSPYASAIVDEPSTRQALQKIIGDVDAHELFDELYTQYKPPKAMGPQTDVLMVTISSFQSACQGHRPWYEKFGMYSGYRRVLFSDRERAEGDLGLPLILKAGDDVPPDRYGNKRKAVEIGLPRIVVIIDDPDRTDFDVRRFVEEDTAEILNDSRRKLAKYQEPLRNPEYWTNKGHGNLTAIEIASYWEDRAKTHYLETIRDDNYERRPDALRLGHKLRRGYSPKDAEGPIMLVTTTEHVTARLAKRTMQYSLKLSDRTPIMNSQVPATRHCHVTVLCSTIVRKANHAVLMLIAEQLKSEFPDEDVRLIADGLGQDLNLSNSRGRNDLASSVTIVKLSIPNPMVAKNLWAQFPSSEEPKKLNTILLADYANQAAGRNQGNRFEQKPCILIVDPMYATTLITSGLLRYNRTPWSFLGQKNGGLTYHGPKTAIETRLMELVRVAHIFGLQDIKRWESLPLKQRVHYEAWLHRQRIAAPWNKEIPSSKKGST